MTEKQPSEYLNEQLLSDLIKSIGPRQYAIIQIGIQVLNTDRRPHELPESIVFEIDPYKLLEDDNK